MDQGRVAKNDETSTIQKMFNLYAYNEISINKVVRQLNIKGLTPKKAEKWTISAVKDILSNPVYIGNLLKTIVKRVEYLKTEKAIKKDSDPTNFELDIYPNIGEFIYYNF